MSRHKTSTSFVYTPPEDLPPPAEVRRGLGWRPEVPDHRDHIAKSMPSSTFQQIALPICTNIRIHDQGMLGSCTGFCGSTTLEGYFRSLGINIRTGEPRPIIDADKWPGAGDSEQHSPLMAYYTAREYIGETLEDYGAYIRDVFRGFLSVGVCPETSWRYNVRNFAIHPSKAAYAKAANLRDMVRGLGLVYERCNDLGAVLTAISNGQPVAIGFMCYNAVFSLNETNDLLPLPTQNDVPVGGHAVCCDGYNIPEGFVNIVNSWGLRWGKRGRFRMPFAWFTDPRRLVDDMWTIRKTAP